MHCRRVWSRRIRVNHIYVPRLPEEPAPFDFGDLDFDFTQIAKLKRATSGVLYLADETHGYAMIESKGALCVPALTWRTRAVPVPCRLPACPLARSTSSRRRASLGSIEGAPRGVEPGRRALATSPWDRRRPRD